jgi:hypothetical protein
VLTGNLIDRKAIPHEPGHFMEFRMLGFVALEEARQARQIGALRSMVGLGDVVAALQTARTDDTVQQAVNDPTTDYDAMTLLTKAIANWSYDEPVTPANIALLDPTTKDWAVREVVTMHMRSQEERDMGLFRAGSSA